MSRAIQSEQVFRGPLFEVERLSWTSVGGSLVVRDVVRHPGAVLIVARTDDGQVVLIRNQRIAVDQRLWELPAGTAEPDETAQTTAARELKEETGFVASRLTTIASFYTSPGFTDELMHVFLAESLTPGQPSTEPWEDITVELIDWNDALAMTLDGRIRDGKTIAGLWIADARIKGAG